MAVKKYIISVSGARCLFLHIYDILASMGMASNLKSDFTPYAATFESPCLTNGQAVEFSTMGTPPGNMYIPRCNIKNSSTFSTLLELYKANSNASQPYNNLNMTLYVDNLNYWFAVCAYDTTSAQSNFIYIGKMASGKKIAFSCGNSYTYVSNYISSPNGCYALDNIASGELKIIAEQREILINGKYAQKDFNLTTANGEILKNGNNYDSILGLKNLCKTTSRGLTLGSNYDIYNNSNFNTSSNTKDLLCTSIKIDFTETVNP